MDHRIRRGVIYALLAASTGTSALAGTSEATQDNNRPVPSFETLAQRFAGLIGLDRSRSEEPSAPALSADGAAPDRSKECPTSGCEEPPRLMVQSDPDG